MAKKPTFPSQTQSAAVYIAVLFALRGDIERASDPKARLAEIRKLAMKYGTTFIPKTLPPAEADAWALDFEADLLRLIDAAARLAGFGSNDPG